MVASVVSHQSPNIRSRGTAQKNPPRKYQPNIPCITSTLTLVASETVINVAEVSSVRLTPLTTSALIAATKPASAARHLLVGLSHGRCAKVGLGLVELTAGAWT